MTGKQRTIIRETITSSELNEDIEIMIYLPNHYSPLYTYPILIAQDGKDYFQLGRLLTISENLFQKQEAENFIIAAIPYKSVKDRRKKYHPNGEDNSNYIRFIVFELLPFLESSFSIHPFADKRALIGDSLGATVSLLTALEYPNLFHKVILQSPFVNDTIIKKVSTSNLSMLSIYHTIGKDEERVKTTNGQLRNFLEPNRNLKKCIENQTPLQYQYFEIDGDHTWKYWQEDLPRALNWIFPLYNKV